MLKRFAAGTIASVAALTFGATLAHAIGYAPEDLTAANSDAVPVAAIHNAAPEDYPARLIIPSLGVDTKVQYVGITSHGTMSVPTNFSDVGWYKYGPVPGAMGSAVMAGHVDNALALPGVFKRLADIKVGADVYVQQKDGNRLHFVVDDVQSYRADEAPASRIFDTTGQISRLNLVTCEGDWIQSERQYDRRLVVYTHLVGGVRPESAREATPTPTTPASEQNPSPRVPAATNNPPPEAQVPVVPQEVPQNEPQPEIIPEYPALPDTTASSTEDSEATSTRAQFGIQ